ncbi:DNA-binding protein [Candidatus Falkowbacteria bacterium CG10_big_fil_rev_8_21_14_0_10_44_15]|uniref:DNA-binding protein n=1 Tax=Candidatus Falkowbacteria bacterium CG10_big_fil_rev_8_21_14_0_10_44_15 TaxID=1974569 RepID=A0A2H0V0A4_9BACT|nr:MAG: DNA-binding protein [Candidatus Falkowbacteria bacterium CG10_big_fil_rev_8_21_14_0_10_44_15]
MQALIPLEKVEDKILLIRGQKVMLDSDLAFLYNIETKILVQAVKRNKERFPEEFMFQLTSKEFENLRSQFVTSSWGGRRYLPFAFTEYGVVMLSSVLKSRKAIAININIVKAFIKLRELAFSYKDLARKLWELEDSPREINFKFFQCKYVICLCFA